MSFYFTDKDNLTAIADKIREACSSENELTVEDLKNLMDGENDALISGEGGADSGEVDMTAQRAVLAGQPALLKDNDITELTSEMTEKIDSLVNFVDTNYAFYFGGLYLKKCTAIPEDALGDGFEKASILVLPECTEFGGYNFSDFGTDNSLQYSRIVYAPKLESISNSCFSNGIITGIYLSKEFIMSEINNGMANMQNIPCPDVIGLSGTFTNAEKETIEAEFSSSEILYGISEFLDRLEIYNELTWLREELT